MSDGRRWDTDQRGHGVAGASDLASDTRRLADALDLPDWIAEEPEAHLLPQIERACATNGSPARLADWSVDADGTLLVRLVNETPLDRRARRAIAYGIIAAVAESRTLVHEHATGDIWEVVTGVLDGDTDFSAHGHRLRLTVETTDVPDR
jgi:hypothetical protein